MVMGHVVAKVYITVVALAHTAPLLLYHYHFWESKLWLLPTARGSGYLATNLTITCISLAWTMHVLQIRQ